MTYFPFPIVISEDLIEKTIYNHMDNQEASFERKLLIEQNKAKAQAIRTQKKFAQLKEVIERLKRELKEARFSGDVYAMSEDRSEETDPYDAKGYDKDGYDKRGLNKYGYDRKGFTRYTYDQQGEVLVYDDEGYDRFGYDKKGLDRDDYDNRGNYLGDPCGT